MEGWKATVEERDSWFSTPQEDRIPHLARTIKEWVWEEDLSRLRLAERLSEEEIVKLLEVQVEGRPVIHLLIDNNQKSTLFPLLDRVTPRQTLLSLIRLEGLGINALGRSICCNSLALLSYLIKRLDKQAELLELAAIPDNEGNTSFHHAANRKTSNFLTDLIKATCSLETRGELAYVLSMRNGYGGTALHWAVRTNHSVSEVLSLLKDETRTHPLLSIRDNEGRSLLSYSICMGSEESFQSIIRYYTGKQAELLELAAIPDNKGNTSFHHAAGQGTSDFLTDLIKATCSLETRGELNNVLSMRDRYGRTALHWAVKTNHSVSEVLSLLEDKIRTHRLLSIRDNDGLSVLSRSIYWGSEESFQSIIRYYTGKQAELLELAAIPDNKGNTSFHYAANRKTSNFLTDLYKATCSLETRGELAYVLSMRNSYGGTALHCAVKTNHSVSEVLSLLEDETRTHRLLSIRGYESRSVLSYSIYVGREKSFQSIIRYYTGKQAELLELAAIPDEVGDTSFHHAAGRGTSDFLTDLIKATCSLETRGELNNVLSMHDRHGCTALHWAVKTNHYVSEVLSLLEDETRTHRLLSIRGYESRSVLSYSIYVGREESFQSIIRYYTGKQAELLELAAIPDEVGDTSFHHAAGRGTSDFLTDLIKATCSLETRGELTNVLSMRDRYGRTALHWAVKTNHSVSEVLSLLEDKIRTHRLLSIRDKDGLSVLSRSIYRGSEESFQSIIRYYTGKQAELLELAAIADNKGNTSFHHAAGQGTSDFLTDLIKATCSLETRGKLTNVLSKCNVDGGKKELGYRVQDKACHSDNDFIYDWAFDSLTNKRYLLFDQPSIIVFYTTVDRSNAETEAQTFIASLKSLGLIVKPVKDFTEEQLFEEIENSQNSGGKNGQIVALMSHGVNGAITDNMRKRIGLKEIERAMNEGDDRTPQVLILQCCQTEKRVTNQTVSTQTEYEPTSSPPTTSNTARASRGQVESGAAAASVNEGETTAHSVSQLEVEPREEWETPQLCTEEDDGSGSKYEVFYPTSRHFCLLTSCSPCRPSVRNRFIPALGDALINLNPNENMATLMMPVKRSVREATKGMQAPSLVDLLEFDLCIKNILPLYLSIKRTESS